MPKFSLRGATILVTGGTGSFGRKIAQHLLRSSPKAIRIFSRDEKKQWDMRNLYSQFEYIIGDVRDYSSLDRAMQGVDYVFHASALKQVPSCEKFPMEAVKTNILGSYNVVEAARKYEVKVVVGLSTDKAVKPVNAMGTSKAMMEKILISQNQSPCKTIFCCVRYGNVMGSRGSVIPLFRQQIASGKPITITVPTMTRFLMSLNDSVDLVVHAMNNAKGGEIFVRKAVGANVLTLAKAVATEFSPLGINHPMEITGPRPGEKLDEVLVNEYEMHRAKETADYFQIYPEYANPKPAGKFGTEYTSANTEQLTSVEQVIELMRNAEVVNVEEKIAA